MKSNFNLLYLVFIFIATSVFAQEDKPETVFITLDTTPKKKKKKEGNFALFWQGSFSGYYSPFPYEESKDRDNDNFENDDEPVCVLCDAIKALDGIGIHNSSGVFFKSFIGISANAGIDLMWYQNLISTPVYGTLTLCPFPKSDVDLLLQASLGRTFALGRGGLSGTYQKYRISLGYLNEIQLFVEVNFYDFPIYHDFGKEANLGIGISIGFLD